MVVATFLYHRYSPVMDGENILTFMEFAVKTMGHKRSKHSTTVLNVYPVMLWGKWLIIYVYASG